MLESKVTMNSAGCRFPEIEKTEIDAEAIKQFKSEDEFTGLSVKILI